MFALASPVLFYFFGILKENEKGDLKNDKTSTAGLQTDSKENKRKVGICGVS